MRVAIASESAPGSENEDFAGSTFKAAVLLDGAGLSGVDDGGCVHGVAWFVRRLGGALLGILAHDPAADLRDVLAAAIDDVADSHGSACDITHPGTPSSTVLIVSAAGDELRYLVLADSVLVLRGPDGTRAITDGREAVIGQRHRAEMDAAQGGTPAHDQARGGYVESLRSYRNREGGFWIAAADPAAARQAIVGSLSKHTALSAALLSDGASRLVDRFHVTSWDGLVSIVERQGCDALLRATREAERSDAQGSRWPRGKIHDDATVGFCDQL